MKKMFFLKLTFAVLLLMNFKTIHSDDFNQQRLENYCEKLEKNINVNLQVFKQVIISEEGKISDKEFIRSVSKRVFKSSWDESKNIFFRSKTLKKIS